MINTRLTLRCFRNHHHTEVEWQSGVNLITGPNGAGKTNLLDALHYVCMGRSFVSGSDIYTVKQGERAFEIEGTFQGAIRREFLVGCTYERGEGKTFFVNKSPLGKHAELIGRVPVVVVSPADRRLTGEGPAERRSFVDAFISQLSPTYLDDLIKYRKIVRQRNRLLSYAQAPGYPLKSMLEPWDEQLVQTGALIADKRSNVLGEFARYLEQAHEELSGSGMRPSVVYKTFCEPADDSSGWVERLREKMQELAQKERERQLTLVGPHRDDLIFFLNEMELRKYGSQGQHRLFALAMKLAQLYYYSDQLEDLPVFLLDDVFGDLDAQRTKVVMNMLLHHPGQSFVTAAHHDKLSGFGQASHERLARYHVRNAEVQRL